MESLDLELSNVDLFIEEIRKHRSIWDMQSEDYKNRTKKQSAWEAVCRNTFLDFEKMSAIEKLAIIKKLALKWKNIKDNYMRSLRIQRKSGRPLGAGRKYLHAKHLSFLHDSIASAETKLKTEDTSLDCSLSQADENEETSLDRLASSNALIPGPNCGAIRTAVVKKTQESPINQVLKNPSIVEQPDSDRSFFDSLFPMIRNFTEDQTLQFRGEVIEVIRRIKRQSTT